MIRPGWLVSYAIIQKDRRHWQYARRAADLGVPVVIDSGAFSVASTGVRVTQFGYANWLRKSQAWRRATWVAALDVIGDPVVTFSNWQALVQAGVPNAVPALHYPAAPDWVSKYAQAGASWIAIGGLVGKPRRDCGATDDQIREWLDGVMDRARAEGIKVHGFGVNARWLVERYGLDSVDSTSFASGTRWRQVPIYDGRRGRGVSPEELTTPQVQALESVGVNVRPLLNAFTVTDTYPQNFAMLHAGLLAVLSALDEWHPGEGVSYFSDWTNRHAQFILDLMAGWHGSPVDYQSTLHTYRTRMRSRELTDARN